MFKIIYNKSTGGSTEGTAPDVFRAKEMARKYLLKDPLGSVEVEFDKRTLTIYYLDKFTKTFRDVRRERYIIAHNFSYPHSSAPTLTEARIKACRLMRKENWKMVGIFVKDAEDRNLLNQISAIITNGYTFEYNDFVKGKTYRLNPETGRLTKW